MNSNQNPNLFRLSLPEWLKEQIESEQHKGVFWIDEKEKIFHVPWKHASRNGWEDDDVSLFKAWAIYTNRYREGIDKPRPALWKTNFRCAINSHNYIDFMADRGERKGDEAHRIMKLIEQPKDKNKVADTCTDLEPMRKRVRVTYPSSSDQCRKKTRSTYANSMTKTSGKIHICSCRNEKGIHFERCISCKMLAEYNTNTTISRNNDHEYLTNSNGQLFMDNKSNIENANTKFENKKPNLQDLYIYGKALQSIDDPSNTNGLDISVKANIMELLKKPIVNAETIIKQENQMNIKKEKDVGYENIGGSTEFHKHYLSLHANTNANTESNSNYTDNTNEPIDESSDSYVEDSDSDDNSSDDDCDLITPRNS